MPSPRAGPFYGYEKDGHLVVNTFYLAEKLCIFYTEILEMIKHSGCPTHVSLNPGSLKAFYLNADFEKEFAELSLKAFEDLIFPNLALLTRAHLRFEIYKQFHDSRASIFATSGMNHPLPPIPKKTRCRLTGTLIYSED